jgi:hypothetical protein
MVLCLVQSGHHYILVYLVFIFITSNYYQAKVLRKQAPSTKQEHLSERADEIIWFLRIKLQISIVCK